MAMCGEVLVDMDNQRIFSVATGTDPSLCGEIILGEELPKLWSEG